MNETPLIQDMKEALSNAEFAAKLLLFMVDSVPVENEHAIFAVTPEELTSLLEGFKIDEKVLGSDQAFKRSFLNVKT